MPILANGRWIRAGQHVLLVVKISRRRLLASPICLLPCAETTAGVYSARRGRRPVERQARMDRLDRADRTEPTLAADKTEKAEASEPTEPTEPIEPAEPIDRIEPLDPMLRMEPEDPEDPGGADGAQEDRIKAFWHRLPRARVAGAAS